MECLSKINLIQKVNAELYKSLGVEDDNLAEYLIYLCKKAKSLEEFCKEVFENGGEIEQSVLKYLYDIIKIPDGESGGKASGGKENRTDDTEEEEEDGVDKEKRLEMKMIEKKNEKMKRFHCLTIKNDEQLTRLSEGSGLEGGSDTATGGGRSRKRSHHRDGHSNGDRDDSQDGSHIHGKDRHDRRSRYEDKSRHEDRSHREDRLRHRDGHRHREEHHRRDRSHSREGDHKRRRREGAESFALRVNNIFSGKVSKIMDFGMFVSFRTEPGGYKEGLVHCTDILPNRKRVVNMSEKFQKGMKVKVKVKAIFGEKINLNMSEVDQKTGKDLVSDYEEDSHRGENSYGKEGQKNVMSIFDDLHEDYKELKKHNSDVFKEDVKDTMKYESVIKMQSDYAKWEIQQLIKGGIMYDEEIKKEYKNLRNDEKIEDEEEIIEIEVNEKEPSFLKGQTTKAGAKLSPIQVIVNAEGSLARAITTTCALAKERKEQKQNEQNAIYDSIPKDISRPWEDPKPELGERTIAEALKNIGKNYDLPEWRKNYLHNNISIGVKNPMPVNEQREKLPIYHLKKDLMKAIAKNNVLIVIGETGSGKTTQIPQYLHEANYTDKGIVGCTQPRRVAAMSIAKRVSEEFGCILGQEVGYSIRFDDCTSNDTIIKYLTDGMLLRETLSDTMLSKYSFIILDEAHERTISTDILFCLLKDVVKRRPDFKLIVTSATLDAEKFSTYFFNSPIFTIPGKIFPVEILHSKEPESDYVEACLITVLNIHLNEHPGDILVFLTGQDEINTACEILHERMKKLESMSPPPLIILPIYSSLPSEMQSVIFDPAPQGCRKCVLATNIAEASLTIDGIFFVIDPGFCKIRKYDSKRDMDSLVVAPISKANAKQRAGRAGRTGPGKCYRLYTEDAYKNEMAETSIPEIQRINLGSTVLLLKALGVNDFLHFDFMDSPSVDTLIHSLENLYYLGALDDNGYLTKLGKKMSNFPMEPTLSKILLTSINFNCADDVVTIVSMLSVQNIFYRPQNKALLADKKKNKFIMPQGDLITYLNIYNRWRENNYSNYWCHENFIHSRALRRSQDVRKQILSIFERYNYEVEKNKSRNDSAKYVSICKSICSGYFSHVCKRDAQQGYTTLLTNQQVFIHPSSTLFNKNPLFVVYHELVLTNKEYIRDCTIIQPQWLIQLAPNLFIPADEKKISKIKLREKIEPLHNYYEEPNAWRLSRRKG
ncbi:pre-mRNA-splicing factor ATP-dependent RNA helicase PRP22, putative [Plasmodium knowlesi strain H]|uniref:RNA helicase n=3 Tax=Plasmodium knowlesi TaxID=5850 RepID=A0A5K1V1U6_PLAKH|nr:pre-mRNA-splicing factor ATP-dependent RNA helicase PRP22, putative [Plasmodium knowlesi strain H]OTN68172.1 putative Pre-mRNA-splicing factor ATP-dependent RNA helicase PRP22 [Plasmodium knowlesi]CAA9987198.1 pre-mRNA-splicing factor ATP-dependent RNA helicase PRP22, putative [Plasmodium knowlesi strain H]SBO23961.1 pre-mRNA-splicing factor ATP-dependent RNA helicase PRP22, putative [Plasmodium knowlesi strain H]SBO25913.1 pre-mRNA-splicing factor ATP-dependent RNA helicase PRP22, putative |eukprot:XP_002261819.1 RNA helicase, putative [Plasmodium knowlesi strain H]